MQEWRAEEDSAWEQLARVEEYLTERMNLAYLAFRRKDEVFRWQCDRLSKDEPLYKEWKHVYLEYQHAYDARELIRALIRKEEPRI